MREQPGAELFATAEVDVDECADLAARDRTIAKHVAAARLDAQGSNECPWARALRCALDQVGVGGDVVGAAAGRIDAGGVQGRPPDHARVAVAAISSPRTVEYHLHMVFGKLDISSRTELGGALLGAKRTAAGLVELPTFLVNGWEEVSGLRRRLRSATTEAPKEGRTWKTVDASSDWRGG
jgi:hypothetical protein